MARQTRPPALRSSRDFTLPWLLGIGLVLASFFVLFLLLGWFATLEMLAAGVGAVAMGSLFVVYALANPDSGWALWAGYLLASMGIVLAVGFLLDFAPTVMLATGVGLLGLPFLGIYISQTWLNRVSGYWWAGLISGFLITTGGTMLHLRAGWPPHLLRGMMIATFMAGVSLTAFLVWLPNWQDRTIRWLVLLTLVTFSVSVFGVLDLINLEILIPVLPLLGGGLFLLIRGIITSAAAVRARQPAATGQISAPADQKTLPPPAPDDTQPFEPQPTREIRPTPENSDLTLKDIPPEPPELP
ncbi:MAG: hypothetical protein Kow0077_27780 [Anaerolineae bacterium]